MKWQRFVSAGARELRAEIESLGPERFSVRLEGRAEPLEVVWLGGGARAAVLVDGRALELFETAAGELAVHPARASVRASARAARGAEQRGAGATGTTVLRAPMPGRVLKVLVAEGATVGADAALVVIEAMKMENELFAGRAGVVKRVLARTGDAVERDAPLVEIE